MVYLSDLAAELGMDRSNMRKYLIKKGINTFKTRDPESKQLVVTISPEEADRVRDIRSREGFGRKDPLTISECDDGFFYLIQLIPEFDASRIKLGFTNDVNSRLCSHRTSSPTAVLVKIWKCKRSWERVAIESATRLGCKLISGEVYNCDSVENITRRLDDFFSIMPEV